MLDFPGNFAYLWRQQLQNIFFLSYFAFQFRLTQNKMLIEFMHYITYYMMFSKVLAERGEKDFVHKKKEHTRP